MVLRLIAPPADLFESLFPPHHEDVVRYVRNSDVPIKTKCRECFGSICWSTIAALVCGRPGGAKRDVDIPQTIKLEIIHITIML